MENIIVYGNGELEINVSIKEDTLWLTQKQIAELFAVTIPNINMHIKAIYKEDELDKSPTIKKYLTVQKEGNREVSRNLEHYNLDVIISVGYRVNSIKATKFRQWATTVLKSYISNGYAINSERITNERFVLLENNVNILRQEIGDLKSKVKDDVLEYKQGIFYNGQTFDAYEFIATLIRGAKQEIKLIDNYIDETVLTLFSKNQDIQVTIYTQKISNQLKLDLEKYNSQYNPIEIKKFDNSHDRFMIIDEKEIYHIGASLKDLGKKWFAFSKMDGESLSILDKLVWVV